MASAAPERPDTVLAAPVNGVPEGAGGVIVAPVELPVDVAMVALALGVMDELGPVTSGMRTGVEVEAEAEVVAGRDEARTTVYVTVAVEVLVTVVVSAPATATPKATERMVVKRIS